MLTRDPAAPSDVADGRHPPTGEGIRPRDGLAPLLLPAAGVALVVALAGGCSNDSNDQQTAPVALGMTSSIAPYYSDQNITIYQVQVPVQFPVKQPSSADTSNPPPNNTPYAYSPYLVASDESVEVHYTLSNLDNQDQTVWLLVDPWNEFVRWNPGITVVNEDVTLPNYGYDQAFIVPAMSRVEGTITTDDFIEIATKLASVQQLLASPQAMAAAAADAGSMNTFDATGLANHIFNPQNRSNAWDPLYQPWIPPVIAGVTGFDLGLRTYDTAANIAVEITVDIVDQNGDRFVPADSNDPQLGPPPATLSPPSARVP
jgi:hypothetical protein